MTLFFVILPQLGLETVSLQPQALGITGIDTPHPPPQAGLPQPQFRAGIGAHLTGAGAQLTFGAHLVFGLKHPFPEFMLLHPETVKNRANSNKL